MFGWGGGRVRRHGGGRRGFSLTSGIGYGNAGNVPEYSVRGGGIPIDVMAITNRWQVVDALPTRGPGKVDRRALRTRFGG